MVDQVYTVGVESWMGGLWKVFGSAGLTVKEKGRATHRKPVINNEKVEGQRCSYYGVIRSGPKNSALTHTRLHGARARVGRYIIKIVVDWHALACGKGVCVADVAVEEGGETEDME
jgi:hypothetical protein